MDKKIGFVAGLTAMVAVGSVHAEASCPYIPPSGIPSAVVGTPVLPVTNPETGHKFVVYMATEIIWEDAQKFVACLPKIADANGLEVGAHLATITSSRENAWIVDTLLRPAINSGALAGKTQVWVGGEQDINETTSVVSGWTWVNNEGPIGGLSGESDNGEYTNWAKDNPDTTVVDSEPNDSGPESPNRKIEDGNENHLTLGRFGGDPYLNLYLWNDEGSNVGSIGGFIVEYDTPRSLAAECTGTTTDGVTCPTVNGQTIAFPPNTFLAGSNFTFTAYEFTDPRVDNDPLSPTYKRCTGRTKLEVFTEPAFFVEVPATPPATGTVSVSGKITIPEHLCGSPKFLIVRAVDNGISVPSGVVTTTNKTVVNDEPNGAPILPNNFYDCEGPSPQQKDVGVWQDLNPAVMRESKPAYTGYFGSVAELTTACGSTVLKTVKKSNFLVGLHYDFVVPGVPGALAPFGSAAEYQAFLDLTKRKVSLALESVNEAIVNKSFIKNPDGQAMQSQLTAVLGALNKNDLSNARKKTVDFLSKVKSSGYKPGTLPFNYNGDHLSRGENILFMLDKNLIPFKNSPVIP